MPVLRLLQLNLELAVDRDEFNDSVGIVLLQETNGQLHPVEYFSTKYSPTECNWLIIDKEFLAIYKAC